MQKGIRIGSAILGIVLITVFVLAIIGRIPWQWFWVTALVIGVLAYYVIPRLRSKFN